MKLVVSVSQHANIQFNLKVLFSETESLSVAAEWTGNFLLG